MSDYTLMTPLMTLCPVCRGACGRLVGWPAKITPSEPRWEPCAHCNALGVVPPKVQPAPAGATKEG